MNRFGRIEWKPGLGQGLVCVASWQSIQRDEPLTPRRPASIRIFRCRGVDSPPVESSTRTRVADAVRRAATSRPHARPRVWYRTVDRRNAKYKLKLLNQWAAFHTKVQQLSTAPSADGKDEQGGMSIELPVREDSRT